MRTKILAATAALPSRTKTGLVALGTVTVLLASACAASHEAKAQSDAGAGAGSTTSSSSRAAKVGSRIVLNGRSDGEKVEVAVTLTKVVPFARSEWDPDPMGGRLQRPDGLRHYAVQFRLTNIGKTHARIWPSSAGQLVDSKGQSYGFYLNNGVPSCHGFNDKESIGSGSSALGCVARDIPKHAAITRVRFTLHSGDTGQWNVG